MIRQAGSGATILLLLAGCTTSLTPLAEEAGPASVVAPGIPYRLPMAQIDLGVTWTLSGCDVWTVETLNGTVTQITDQDGMYVVVGPSNELAKVSQISNATVWPSEERAAQEVWIQFETLADYKASIVEGESLLIDYSNLTNYFKKGEVSVGYHEDTMVLKTINSTIEGAEAKALGSAINLGANVARIVLGLPAPATTAAAAADALVEDAGPRPRHSTKYSACTDTAQRLVSEKRNLDALIKEIPPQAQEVEARIALLKARAIGGQLSKADEQEYDELVRRADGLASKLERAKDSIKELRRHLAFRKSWIFPDRIQLRSDLLLPTDTELGKWLWPLLKPTSVDAAGYAAIKKRLTVVADLQPLVAEFACVTNGEEPECAPPGRHTGVVFRQPVQARLTVRQGSEEPMISETVAVPQFGRVRVLPLQSDWGEKNSLVAEFSKSGVPTRVEYRVLSAPGVDALGAGNDAALAYLGLRDEIRAQAEKEEEEEKSSAVEAETAELEALKRQIELAENRAKLAQIEVGKPATVEELEAELAVLRLKKEKSDLAKAIRDNKAADGSDE